MGAKASTANATSDSNSIVGASTINGVLRSLPHIDTSDRQRARSLSSVPDSHNHDEDGQLGTSTSDNTTQEADNSLDDNLLNIPSVQNLGIGRVFAARSLPSYIWSLNGLKCPVCSKYVLPDDVECHLVMCLTKPRLIYNEDVLTCDKGECVICFEELLQGDTIARLPCLCIYHKSCIDRWFDVNRSCPEHPGD